MATTTSSTSTPGAPSAAPDTAASPGPAQGGGSRKVTLSTERDQEGAARPPEAVRTEDSSAVQSRRQPPQPERPADRRDVAPGSAAQRSGAPAVEPVEAARAQVSRYLRENAVLSLGEEVQFRDAKARGDDTAAAAVRKGATGRNERDLRAVERATPAEVRELSQLLAAPASSQVEKRFREILDEVDRRGRAQSNASRDAAAAPAEVGRVSGVERDRNQARAEDLNDRDPLRAWQARMVELRDRRAEGFVPDGGKYLYRGQLAFVDEGKSIRAFDASPRTAQAIVDLAESKRWSELRVEGVVDFQRAVWMEARARSMDVRTAEFQPTKLDREQAEQRAAEYRERYGLRVPVQEAVRTAGASTETPRREVERSEASSPAPARAGARLVEFGTAPYEFKRGADPSFFVKTERDSGEQRVVWGKDLERALRAADAQVGDRIRLEREGGKPVNVTATEWRDGTPFAKNLAAERGVWKVDVVERGAREVAQTPAQATVERVLRDAGSSQSVIDRALRTAAERESALASQGRVIEVRGVDPQAPRTTPVPTVQVQEQSAPTRVR